MEKAFWSRISSYHFIASLLLLRLPRLFIDRWIYGIVLLLSFFSFWFIIFRYFIGDVTEDGNRNAGSSFVLIILISILAFVVIFIYIICYTIFAKVFFFDLPISIGVIYTFPLLGFISLSFLLVIKFAQRSTTRQSFLFIGIIYFSLVIIAILRYNDPIKLFGVITLFVYVMTIINLNKSKLGEKFLFECFICLLIYMLANILLLRFGVQPKVVLYQRAFRAVILSFLGIEGHRTFFPMAEGINAYGMFAGAALVMSGVFIQNGLKSKKKLNVIFIVALIGFFISLYTILLTDSRGAILCSVLVLFFVWPLKRFLRLIMLIPILTLVLPFILAGRSIYLGNLVASLSRVDTDIFSNRTTIWQSAIYKLSNFEAEHLIGYGLYGQNKSGVISDYREIFKAYEKKDVIGLHNFWLQTIIDTGYLGLVTSFVFYMSFLVSLYKISAKYKFTREIKLTLSILLYILFIGIFSLIPMIYSPESFYLLIIIWAFVLISNTGYESIQ